MGVKSLGYLILASDQAEAWRSFGTDVLGAMDVSVPGAALGLKVDDHPFRILIEEGDRTHLTAMGWELANRDEWESMRARLRAAGVEVREGDRASADKRCVTDFFAATDPEGSPLEFYYGRTGIGGKFESPIGVPRFLTGEMGLGHVVIPAPGDLFRTHEFYKSVLGLGESDDLTIAPPGAPPIRILFMHADNPRHHSLALVNQPVPTGIVHLMLEVPDLNEVGRCLDRTLARKIPLMASLGRHCNDNMLSFYAIGPGGVAVEYGCEGLKLDWSSFEPTISTVSDFWGHAYAQLAG